jgi:hypothetical protein
MHTHLPLNRSNPDTNAKRAAALALRQQNKSFQEIGEHLGLSANRCRGLVKEAERVAAHEGSWLDGLSTFLAGALANADYKSINDVLAAFQQYHDKPTMPDFFWSKHGSKADLDLVGLKRIHELGVWVSEQLSSQDASN